MLYSRSQLRVLLVLAALFLAGLGVRQWRAGFPDAALRLERFDREPEPTGPLSARDTADGPPASLPPPSIPARMPEGTARETPSTPPDPRPLDLNRASLAELSRLPGVGPGLARRILEDRNRRGRFESTEALGRIVGLGPKKLASLRELVTTGD